MYFLYFCTLYFCSESTPVPKYIVPTRIFHRDVLCTFERPCVRPDPSDSITTNLNYIIATIDIHEIRLKAQQPAMSSTSSSDSSFNISEDSILKTDSDGDQDVEREQKQAKKRRFFLTLLAIRHRKNCRSKKWSPPRLIWAEYVAELEHQNEFNVTFRMSLSSFNMLVDLLRVKLTVDENQAIRSSSDKKGCILPELVVAMSLRWLAGGQWQDIKKVYGVSRSHFYHLRSKFLDAVMDCPDLEIRLPDCKDIEALELIASQFEANASRSVFRGCVGALDGLTVLIKAPSAAEAENVLSYYSGHYKHDSLNVQAMSNHCGKFLYFAVAAPGSSPDASALALTRLQQWIDALPHGFYVVADNAYIISEHTLIPFSGSQRAVPQHSCYNYFLSQLRIRVEQAFGQYSVKWRIIRKPLDTCLETSSKLLTACARLHNFIIDNDWQQCNEEITAVDVVGSLNEIYRPSLSTFEIQPGVSFLRDNIVSYIEENGYRRPSYNRLRNDQVNFEVYETQHRLM